MKRKLLISLGLALMLTLLVAVGAMAASDKLTITGYETFTAGFSSATPSVALKSSNATVTGVTFSAKPAKVATIDPATGVLTGKKAGKVTVTAKYVDEAGKTIKGTKSVKVVANKFTGKAKSGSAAGVYFSTKKLSYSADGQYLIAEMYIYNKSGKRATYGPLTDWPAMIVDASIAETGFVMPKSTQILPHKYAKGGKNSVVGNKKSFVAVYKFPVASNTGLGGLDLRGGNYRVYFYTYPSLNIKGINIG